VHDAGESAFGYASEVLGKDAFVSEIGGALGPADLQEPAVFVLQRTREGNLRGGNYEERSEMRIKRADLLRANEELNGSWSGV